MKLPTACILLGSSWASSCLALSSTSTPTATATATSKITSSSSSSHALNTILANENETTEQFFRNTWQKKPHVYRQNHSRSESDSKSSSNSNSNSDSNPNPFYNQIQMGLPGITHALENACEAFLAPPSPEWQFTLPIISKDKQCLSLEQLVPLYGNNLFEAYLDGCSILLNHNDRHCPHTAALCQDLQKSFPYVYANAYLTPPASQAVSAHADDRDVIVIQVYGNKVWKVYEDVPIEYPYTHEQVGKNDLPVPQSVLDGDLLIDTVLQPGDVLYIPRGFVHEACTHRQERQNDSDSEINSNIQPSFHITIAIATFDWAMSGLLATAVKKTLDEIPEYRMALPVEFGMRDTEDISIEQRTLLEKQVDEALEIVKKQMTADAMNNYLTQKYQWHANQSESARLARIHQYQTATRMGSNHMGIPRVFGVGSDAMRDLSMESLVRASTKEESESLLLTNNGTPRLKQQTRVRDETQAALHQILEHVQANPEETFRLSDMIQLIDDDVNDEVKLGCDYICDLTLLSFVRSCVERGSMSVVG